MILSIIILNHNDSSFTLRCLDSLGDLMSKYDDIQIVVIDNGSTEDIEPLLADKKNIWNHRLTLIKLNKNRGVAAGRNIGLKLGETSRYIMFLDNDTIVSTGAIEYLLHTMDQNPQFGLIAPRLISPDGHTQKSFKPFPGICEKIKNFLGGKNTIDVPDHIKIIYPFYVIGACQLIRNSVIRQIGKLDEKIFFGPEDADYCMRIRNAGLKVAYIPSVSITHDWQRTSHRSPLSQTARQHLKALIYFYWKWKKF